MKLIKIRKADADVHLGKIVQLNAMLKGKFAKKPVDEKQRAQILKSASEVLDEINREFLKVEQSSRESAQKIVLPANEFYKKMKKEWK